MIKSERFSDNKFFRIIFYLLQPGIIALGAVVLLYTLIFWSINKGVSIDEGYYLLGYLHDQQLGPSTTDFHRIVRALFFFIPEDNVLMYRWVRVVLTILLLFLFLHTSYRWLVKQNDYSINKLLYYSMGFLAGTMCFSYASPVFYYDNIQLIVYLITFSLFFYNQFASSSLNKIWSFSVMGIIMLVGLTNYPPSGVLLILIVFFLLGLLYSPSLKKIISAWLIILFGILIGALLYSLFIHNILDFLKDFVLAYSISTKAPNHKYDTDGQWLVIGKYFLGMLKVYIPVLGLSVVYFLLVYKKLINRIVLNIVFGFVLLLVTYKFSVYFSNILLLPVILLLYDAIINLISMKIKFRLSKNLVLAMLLLALPLLAVAGSNQRLEMKMVYFMPFWFLAYFILVAEFKKYLDPQRIPVLHTVFIVVFFIVFAAQGFLKHIHYNYSIKRSRYLIENAERFTNIGVSEYQYDFYENGIRELKKAGFRPGDEVLAFYETFMLVYAAGGYVPHRLTYSAEFFVAGKDNIPPKKTDYLIINEYQIPILSQFLENTDWDFPDSYNRVDLGTDGPNLAHMGYNYILFSRK